VVGEVFAVYWFSFTELPNYSFTNFCPDTVEPSNFQIVQFFKEPGATLTPQGCQRIAHYVVRINCERRQLTKASFGAVRFRRVAASETGRIGYRKDFHRSWAIRRAFRVSWQQMRIDLSLRAEIAEASEALLRGSLECAITL
jgi:hypothetical protein